MLDDLIGFRVCNRYGAMGVVVRVREPEPGREAEVMVRGGVTRGLLYVVPEPRILSVARPQRALVVDVEITDFVPSLRSDGTVELRLGRD